MPRVDQAVELARAEGHVRKGEEIVARQKRLIGELQRDGHASGAAELLLGKFEDTLRQFRIELERLRRQAPP